MAQTNEQHHTTANGPDRSNIRRLREQTRQVREQAQTLASDVDEIVGELRDIVREQLDRRPYATLAAASGIGYLLGRGLPPRFTRLLFDFGTRLVPMLVVQQLTGQRTNASGATDWGHDGEE